MKNIRWGILGAGKIASKFASAINFVEGNVLRAVASRDAAKAHDFAQRCHAEVVYDNYEALAADKNIDIIYVATPHAFHCEQTLLCLAAGKPVLCEKPMALNEAEVTKMFAAAAQQDTFLMEGMWSRFMPAINKVQQLISDDVIGKVQYARADFGFAAPFDASGRLYNLNLGGGSLLDVGIYPLFLTVLLFGEPSSVQSTARLSETGADEYCNVIFQYPGGETASIFSSIVTKTSLTAEIAGSKGRVIMHNPWYRTHSITVELNEGETTSYSFPHDHNGFEYQVRHVMDCLQQGVKVSPLLPPDFSITMSRIMDTIRRQAGVRYAVDERTG